MKIYSIISQKGGAGKTTIALNLASISEKRGLTTVIIDIDPQASATQWGDNREQEKPVIISAQATRLETVIATAKENKVDVVIIDTAPHSDSASLTASRVSDVVIIPCRPSVLDLRAISQSVDIASLTRKKAVVVINSAPHRGGLSNEAKEVIEQYNVIIAPNVITHRAAFYHSLTEGKTVQEYDPNSKATQEIIDLYNFIEKI